MPTKVEKWVAQDGTEFTTESDALMHEELQDVLRELKGYLGLNYPKTPEEDYDIRRSKDATFETISEDPYKFANILKPLLRHT